MKKMKILIFGLTPLIGGVETYIINLVKNIDREKFEINFLVQEEITGLNKEKIDGYFNKIYIVENLKRHPIKALRTLKRLYLQEKFDVIHLNISTASSALYALPSKIYSKGTKIIVHSHNGGDKNKLQHYIFRFILNKITDEYLSCSKLAANWMFGERIESSNRVTITNNAIETDKFIFDIGIRNEKRKELGVKENDFIIGHVGRFNEQKNHLRMLEILQPILSESESIKLILIGAGELEQKVKNKAQSMKIDNKIMFLGPIKNVNEYYQAMDLFILPSIFEGLPIVGIEAQASGLKCIFSDNITKEVDITGNSIFISTSAQEKWRKAIYAIKDRGYIRKNEKNNIIKNGYDLKEEIKKIEKIYLN